MMLEIERKYLLDRMPVVPVHAETWRIEQGYLEIQMDGGNEALMTGEPVEVGGRVRRAVSMDGLVILTHTIKRGVGLVREELERPINIRQFQRVWRNPAAFRLRKTRYRVAVGDRVWEVDEFEDLDMVLAEVELPSRDAETVIPPWLANHIVREVTDEPAYTNHAIARRLAVGG
ncbi:MAG: hypothetical protein JSV91_05690 [Phycisphaerales bacterium]|nr:MAG: hypothetical protein JSV91_05690 [Phycisphaerales bacterium]